MAHDTPQGSLTDISFRSIVASMFGGEAGDSPTHGTKWKKKRFGNKVYLPVLIPTILLVAYGLIAVWSASLTIADASAPRQAVGVVLGSIAAVVIWRYDYRDLSNLTKFLLIFDIILMLLPSVPGLSYTAKGMTGWIRIPLIHMTFQTSEPAKLVTICLMAALTAQYNGKIDTLKDYLKLCVYLSVPFLLILTQPDLGTGLVILVSGATIIVCGGAKRSWVLITIALIVVGATFVVVTSSLEGFPHILKSYQLKRLLVFVDPTQDPSGDGYNLLQAKIAVGSGGFIGKGIGNATQAAGGFLPEAHTDFIFALISEEFGFLGDLVLLVLYVWLLLSTLQLAVRTESTFGKLILSGIVAMWTFQVFENIGMNIGIMPITGIPLPFISFGSSSMITQVMVVGMVQSVYRHRTKAA